MEKTKDVLPRFILAAIVLISGMICNSFFDVRGYAAVVDPLLHLGNSRAVDGGKKD